MNPGRVGSYEPLIELASGGMGVVYVARKVGDAGFERLVVLKRVHRRLLADPSFRKMLRDEAEVLSRVHDAHVASVLDVVDAEGELSIVLEYVESLSLAALLRAARARDRRMPVAVVTRIVSDALAGLHAAHAAVDGDGAPLALIHRDVSPQNIIVGVDGTSRLIDFGIAKATTEAAASGREVEPTQSGVLKGKLRYMSPEQVRQAPLDRRSDIFSAGIVLYEALTGEPLFRSDDEGDLLLSLLLGDVKAPSAWVPDLPPALEAVVLRALARDREDRFETAADFAEQLERAVSAAPTREVARYVEEHGAATLAERRDRIRAAARALPVITRTAIPESAPAAHAVVEAPAAPRAQQRSVWLVAAAGTLVALGLAVGLAVALARRSADRPSPAGPSIDAVVPDRTAEAAAPGVDAAAPPTGSAPPRPAAPQGSRPRPARAAPDLHSNPYGPR